MAFIEVGNENSTAINLYYEDHGKGKPVVLIHGFPLSGAAWEKQISVLLHAGHRVITYDRRGFGKSSQPSIGYDYDTFASDLDKIMTKLDLNQTTLIGHSMGTGEIARYLSKFGSERVEKAVFISPLQPFLLKAADNPDGLDRSVFEGFQKNVIEDRFAFLNKFLTDFYSSGILRNNGVSDQAFHSSWIQGAFASPIATHDSIATWMTDFRRDLPAIDVPALILHGTADKILPFPVTAPKMHALVPGSKLVPIDGGPHALPWTHAEEINREILEFLNVGRISTKTPRPYQGLELAAL